MYACPACKTEDVAGQERCRCGADLSLLVRLQALADIWFNRALVAHAQGQHARALELLSACCVVRPDDAEARIVQAQVLAHLGRWQEACEAVHTARDIDPDRVELPSLETALVEAGGPGAISGAEEVAPGVGEKPVSYASPQHRAMRKRGPARRAERHTGRRQRRGR